MASSTTTGLPAAVDGMDPVSWEAVCRRDAYCRSCHQDVVVCTDALGPGDLVEPPSDRKVKIWPAAIAGEPIVRLERPGCAYKDAARRAVAMPIEELLAEQHGRGDATLDLPGVFSHRLMPGAPETTPGGIHWARAVATRPWQVLSRRPRISESAY